jgi:predicted ester cyclase
MTATTEENKELIRELTEAWNARNRERMAATYADEIRVHGADETRSRAEMLEAEWGFFDAFPDVEATTEHLVAEDDLVVVRWSVVGTHEGELRGIEPTGREVEYEEWAMYRIEDGEITEMWAQTDALGVFEQLGAVDPPSG